MDLSYVKDLLVADARQMMASLAVVAPITSKAPALRDLSRLFQGVAICRLLVDYDALKFRENLIRSGHARRYYLRHAHAEHALSDRFLGLSRVEAIFDVIVAGDKNLIQDIVSLSINQWHEGWEYEDDHCYYRFVHRMVSERPFLGSPDAQALIARFETILEGQASSRLDLCKAVQIGDTNAFGDALEEFLNERKQLLDARRETITEYTAQAIFWPQSFVSLEALAWLRLAEMAGIEMKDDFLFCPPEARGRQEQLEVEDFFADLDRALAQEG